MALPVLIMGRSGSGKTYSLKNFQPGEVGIISVEKGRLPFRSELKTIRIPKEYTASTLRQIAEGLDFEYKDKQISSYAELARAQYAWIMYSIKSAKKVKTFVIDDSQYLLSNELFDRAYEKGYDKFTHLATNFRNLVHFINELEDDDKIVYFLHHTEVDADGREKCKTIGKMLDEKLTVEGCFDIVIYCRDHKFITQGNGISTAKSPEDMFPLEMPNDLKEVDKVIREYYGMGVS